MDNARWYDPALGRFAQADSIIPNGLQGLDRYAYTVNNPLKYTDPTGHDTVTTGEHSDWNKILNDLNIQVTDPHGALSTNANKGQINGIIAGAVTGALAVGVTGALAGTFVVPVFGTGTVGIIGSIAGGVVGGLIGYAVESYAEAAKEDVAAISSFMGSLQANADDDSVEYYFKTEYTIIYDPNTGEEVSRVASSTTFYGYDETNKKWVQYEFQTSEGFEIVKDTFTKYGLEPDCHCGYTYKSKWEGNEDGY